MVLNVIKNISIEHAGTINIISGGQCGHPEKRPSYRSLTHDDRVKAVKSCNAKRRFTDDEVFLVASRMTSRWAEVGRELNFSELVLADIDGERGRSVCQKAQKMLHRLDGQSREYTLRLTILFFFLCFAGGSSSKVAKRG